MDVYKVNITEPAENDLRDIARYISFQLLAPATALNMMKTIRREISKLGTNAFIHPLVKDERLAVMGYRLLVIKNYIAFYIVNEAEKTIDVDRVLYGRRDWQQLL